MKRRLFSLFLMLIMMFSVGMTASAVYRPETGMPTINGTRSSAYLDGCSSLYHYFNWNRASNKCRFTSND